MDVIWVQLLFDCYTVNFLWLVLATPFRFIAGVSETVVLNMSTLVWSVVTTVQGRVPLASEVSCITEISYMITYMIASFSYKTLRTQRHIYKKLSSLVSQEGECSIWFKTATTKIKKTCHSDNPRCRTRVGSTLQHVLNPRLTLHIWGKGFWVFCIGVCDQSKNITRWKRLTL